MHFLVTGAQGLLGSQIVTQLKNKGMEVTASGRRIAPSIFCCDLSDRIAVKNLVAAIRPDRIIHCASHVPRSGVEYNDKNSTIQNLNMLENLMLASDCPILFTSSMTVYGATRDRPFREEDGGQPKSAYGVGKWHAELLLSKYGSSSLAIRLPGLFGQARRSGLIYNVLSAYKQGVTLPKLPDEPVLWSALHVNDAAVGVTKLALGVITDNQAINLGYRGKIGVNSFLAIAAKLFSRVCINIKDQPEFEFELSRAEAMGVVPDKTFQEALQQFANEL